MPEHKDITGADLHIPGTHASSHATAGSDAITPASIGAASLLELSSHTGATNPHNIGKSSVGLGNCDNTSDADKPVSTAQAAAIAVKADKIRVPTNILTDGLVRYFPLNGDINDYSGLEYHGSIVGNAIYSYDAVFGRRVFVCDGTNAITFPDTGLPATSNPSTICCWAMTTSPTTRGLFGYGTTGTSGYVRELVTQGSSTYEYRYNVYNFRVSAYNYSASGPTWRHIAAVFNGTTSIIYIDGIAVGSASLGHDTHLNAGVIGYTPSIATKFVGSIADARIYSASLSADQILAIAKWEI